MPEDNETLTNISESTVLATISKYKMVISCFASHINIDLVREGQIKRLKHCEINAALTLWRKIQDFQTCGRLKASCNYVLREITESIFLVLL
jgi:hypothetical protein